MFGRVMVVATIVGGLVGGASARDGVGGGAPRPIGAQEASVVAVMVDPGSGQPAVVLEGTRDHRRFAMAIGLAEATSIAVPLQGVTPPRPLTHDLFLTLFGRLKVSLSRVVIDDFRDDTYFATVHLTIDGKAMTLDARPSDAIALAIRAKVPVVVEERVFERGGLPPAPEPRRQRT